VGITYILLAISHAKMRLAGKKNEYFSQSVGPRTGMRCGKKC
jgi:hypothetical protein